MYNVVRCVSSGTPRRLCRLMPYPETCQHRRSEPQAMRPKVAEPLKLHQIGIWRQLGDKRKRLCADKLRQIVHDLVSALWLSLLWAVWLAGRPPVPLVGCLALPLLRVAPTAEQGERRRIRGGARPADFPASRKVPVRVPASAGLKWNSSGSGVIV